jgi:D-serine deaminase-like pyridoxal phosphate-dependent protein
MKITQLDTPSLLVDVPIMMNNMRWMQQLADRWNVALRPHTKTHKTPGIAKMQLETGACGITVAKTGEAEVMASAGIREIFIANEIVGMEKLTRIRALCEKGISVSFGVDSTFAIEQIGQVFDPSCPAHVLIEVETGDHRSGVTDTNVFVNLLGMISRTPSIKFEGVFSHEGHTYKAPDIATAAMFFRRAQEDTLSHVALAAREGFECNRVSIGSTPGIVCAQAVDADILEGITEIRPGTYVFMDAGQANVLGSYDRCAATVLATVISKPTTARTIADAGAKALTMQSRTEGICTTEGKGVVLNPVKTHVASVYDEHTIFDDQAFGEAVEIGDKIRIIPNHICPVVNLYDQLHLVEGDEVVETLCIAGRGKIT